MDLNDEDNKKIIKKKNLIALMIKNNNKMIQNDPYKNPFKHQFREINKLKWLTKRGFITS